MANDYLCRIEALEAAIAPSEQTLVVIPRKGEDSEAAIDRVCAEKGLRRDDPHLKLLVVAFPDDR